MCDPMQGNMDKAMAAREWSALSDGASAGGSTQTTALQFKSSMLEAEFAAHHAVLLARRVHPRTFAAYPPYQQWSSRFVLVQTSVSPTSLRNLRKVR